MRPLQLSIDRTVLLFVSGGLLCFTCCLLCPLPETILYDLPDSLTDLQSMKRAVGNENNTDQSHYHMIDSATMSFPGLGLTHAPNISHMHDLLSTSPPAPFGTQQQPDGRSVNMDPNAASLNGLSDTCYFTPVNDTLDQFDVEQQFDPRRALHSRSGQTGIINSNNNNNAAIEHGDADQQMTKF